MLFIAVLSDLDIEIQPVNGIFQTSMVVLAA